jgi:hypothetical protein
LGIPKASSAYWSGFFTDFFLVDFGFSFPNTTFQTQINKTESHRKGFANPIAHQSIKKGTPFSVCLLDLGLNPDYYSFGAAFSWANYQIVI